MRFCLRGAICPSRIIGSNDVTGLAGIGSRDLEIAATALANDVLLLSANRTDFESVPDLQVENWLD